MYIQNTGTARRISSKTSFLVPGSAPETRSRVPLHPDGLRLSRHHSRARSRHLLQYIMENPFFDRPILNSPYLRPGRHWELDEDGQPTQQVVEVRRPAKYITP